MRLCAKKACPNRQANKQAKVLSVSSQLEVHGPSCSVYNAKACTCDSGDEVVQNGTETTQKGEYNLTTKGMTQDTTTIETRPQTEGSCASNKNLFQAFLQ